MQTGGEIGTERLIFAAERHKRMEQRERGPRLILQRHHWKVAATERGHSLKAIRLRQGHDRAVAINRMAIRGEVPLPTLPLCRLLARSGREFRWGRELGKRER